MKSLLIIVTILLTASLTHAADECCPADQAGAQPKPAALPAGHPPIDAMKAGAVVLAADPAPTTQPGATGVIEIQTRQGTQGAAPAGADAATLEYYHHGQAVKKIEIKLDDQGFARITDVPLASGFQPVVTVTHAGVAYEAVGHPVDATRPLQVIEVPVYETTEVQPAWQIKMRHVMVDRAPQGLRVLEMISVTNPTDRAWLGAAVPGDKSADEHAQGVARQALIIPVPKAAIEVQVVEGFHECCTKFENGSVVSAMPLLPGESRYQLLYIIPVTHDHAQIAITAPAVVAHMMVFLPDDASQVSAEGLQLMGTMKMHETQVRVFAATKLGLGATTTLALTSIPAAPVAAVATAGVQAPAAPAATTPKLIAGIGGGVILLAGVAVLFLKPRKASAHA